MKKTQISSSDHLQSILFVRPPKLLQLVLNCSKKCEKTFFVCSVQTSKSILKMKEQVARKSLSVTFMTIESYFKRKKIGGSDKKLLY